MACGKDYQDLRGALNLSKTADVLGDHHQTSGAHFQSVEPRSSMHFQTYQPYTAFGLFAALLQLANIHNADLHHICGARRQHPTAHDEQLLLIFQHPQMSRIRSLLRRRNTRPRTLTKRLVDVDI
jgi:hypothetical protein